jgi:hypothetical protein
VSEFLVEAYVSRNAPQVSPRWAFEMSRVADRLTREGVPVRFVRSIFVPEDETCFYLFEARSADDVRTAAERAGLQVERVTEAVSA